MARPWVVNGIRRHWFVTAHTDPAAQRLVGVDPELKSYGRPRRGGVRNGHLDIAGVTGLADRSRVAGEVRDEDFSGCALRYEEPLGFASDILDSVGIWKWELGPGRQQLLGRSIADENAERLGQYWRDQHDVSRGLPVGGQRRSARDGPDSRRRRAELDSTKQ